MAGQVGALAKMYKDGRLPEIMRDEQQRPFRYHTKGTPVVLAQPIPTPEPVTFRPTPQQEEILTALTETKKIPNRSEVVIWLLDQGIAANRVNIDKIMQTYAEIQRLRRQVQQIGP